ncbi:MAG: hypothetical protein PHR94_14270 [Methylomonas lenta]|jgi:hypothetical protein|nr:hypothetical protein [Methylomonas lenta]
MNVNAKVVSIPGSVYENRSEVTASISQAESRLPEINEDDRYPGSFFRVPGLPTPGNTTWSLAK